VLKNPYPLHFFPNFLHFSTASNSSDTNLLLKNGSYGFIYEALLSGYLLNISNDLGEDLNTIYTYLSELAFYMFSNHISEISNDVLHKWHDDYCTISKYELEIDFRKMIELLEFYSIVFRRNNLVSFRFPYMNYFFISIYLCKHIDEKEVIDIINNLVINVHNTENSNILLFVSFKSNSSLVIDSICKFSETIFNGEKPFNLDEMCDFTDGLITETPQLLLYDSSPKENRKELLKSQDKIELNHNHENEDVDNLDEQKLDDNEKELLSLSTSIKLINLLGQIMINSYGSILASQRYQLLNHVFTLGSRTLSLIKRILQENKDDLFSEISEKLREKYPEKNDIELIKIMNVSIFYMCDLIVYSFIKIISEALGSYKINKTLNRFIEDSNNLFNELIGLEIRLNFYPGLPKDTIETLYQKIKKTKLSLTIFRQLIVTFFTFNEVNFRTRKQILDYIGVGIEHQKKMLMEDKTKLK